MVKTVGVALGSFNGARFIGEQLKSIIEQSVPPQQLIVADDGSDDSTFDIVSDLLRDSHVVVTWFDGQTTSKGLKRQLGVAGNFERILREFYRRPIELIALSDQDDYWYPDRLEKLIPLFSNPNVLLVHTDARLVAANGESLGKTLFDYLEISHIEHQRELNGKAFSVFLRRNLVTGATAIFHRDLLEHALPIPEQWLHDEWLAVIAAAFDGVRIVNKSTIDYRQHGANLIGVQKPSLINKLRVISRSRGDKYQRLADRFGTLADRLEQMQPYVRLEYVHAAREKADFERRRANFPKARILRVIPVVRLALSGAYSQFSSRGRADIVRDLIQPA